MKTSLLVLSSLFLLTSCGGQTPDSNIQKDTNTPSQISTETKPSDGVVAIDPSTVDPIAITTQSSTGITERPRN